MARGVREWRTVPPAANSTHSFCESAADAASDGAGASSLRLPWSTVPPSTSFGSAVTALPSPLTFATEAHRSHALRSSLPPCLFAAGLRPRRPTPVTHAAVHGACGERERFERASTHALR